MRLIDADAFKNYIQNGLEDVRHFFKDNGKRAEKIIEGICEDIDEQPTIELPQWIPCSERLPEIEREGQRRGWYITTNGYGSVGMTQYEFYHDLLKTGWQSEHQIVAWMPLPEPYHKTESHEREGE